VTERPIALPPHGNKGSATMATAQECVDYARQCVRLAELTADSELRDHLLTLARDWMATAMQRAEGAEAQIVASLGSSEFANC
jgi:hypothetical protein